MNRLTFTSRRDRRAERAQRFVTARQAQWAARMARLGYKTSGETGALRPPSKGRTWSKTRKNAHAPPPGVGWERSGPMRVVRTGQEGRLEVPVAKEYSLADS